MFIPTRAFKLLNGDLGSNQTVLENMNPNTQIFLVTKLQPEPVQEGPRHLCSGLSVRELCYPVLRIGDTVQDVDHGMFTWTGKEWR